jgi:fatty acid desaturase
MDDFIGRRDLLEPAELKALSARSDARGLVHLGSQALAIAATGYGIWATAGTVWVVPFFIAHGVLLNFLYAGQHEMSHWTAFRSRWLNELFGSICGFIVLYPKGFDRAQHFAHHRHTQDPERDGELVGRPPYTFWSYLLYVTGPAYWYYRTRRIVRHALGIAPEPYLTSIDRPRIVAEARWHVAGYAAIAAASVATGSCAVVTYWLGPMLLTKGVHQLQNTIEHLGMSRVDRTLANTRSTRTNALMRWLAWNMQYHTAHHTFPGVPFHRLAELHRLIVARLGGEPATMRYLDFQWAFIKALAMGGGEAAYPTDRTWIGPPGQPDRIDPATRDAAPGSTHAAA